MIRGDDELGPAGDGDLAQDIALGPRAAQVLGADQPGKGGIRGAANHAGVGGLRLQGDRNNPSQEPLEAFDQLGPRRLERGTGLRDDDGGDGGGGGLPLRRIGDRIVPQPEAVAVVRPGTRGQGEGRQQAEGGRDACPPVFHGSTACPAGA